MHGVLPDCIRLGIFAAYQAPRYVIVHHRAEYHSGNTHQKGALHGQDRVSHLLARRHCVRDVLAAHCIGGSNDPCGAMYQAVGSYALVL